MRISHLDNAVPGGYHTVNGHDAMLVLSSAIAAAIGIMVAVFLCVKKKKDGADSKFEVMHYDVDPEEFEVSQ
jgi:ABC-type methionine transport system permease subunit